MVELQSWNQGYWVDWLQVYRVWLDKDLEGVGDVVVWQVECVCVMYVSNFKYVLRNYIVQNVIEVVECGDFLEVWWVLKLLENFYYCEVGVVIDFEVMEVNGVDSRQCFYSSKFLFWVVELCVI